MKKLLLSVVLLFIAWAASASVASTPRSAIVRLEDAGSPNSRVHRSYAQVCPVGMQPRMCPTGHGFHSAGIGVLPHATRLVALPGYTSAQLRCTRLLNESVSCGHNQTTYDRNANITSLSRQGIVDRTILGNNVFGLHSRYTMKYAVNRLSSMEIEREGEDYEGRTGAYFTPDGVFYYITDWQGNNIAVFSNKGELVQQTTYYPYGEPTIEPTGQRYLFGGKEREHAGGRNSYDYGPRNLGSSANWDSADKLATETPQTSPFSYCGGDPINRVDPTGLAWHLVDSIAGDNPCFKWVDNKLSYDNDGNLKPNHYEQGILFSPTDKEVVYSSSHKDFNIGTSTATVYKADGTTENFDACTVPSDPDKYATVPEGIYEAKVGTHNNSYPALRLADIGTTDFRFNKIELGMPNPSQENVTFALGINIHKPGRGNITGMDSKGRIISKGCFLIDYNHWADFISIFNTESQRGNVIGIIIIR